MSLASPADPSARLLSRPQAAELLGIAPQTLAVWAVTGRYRLPFVKVGRRAMYRQSDLDAFVASRTITHGAERVQEA